MKAVTPGHPTASELAGEMLIELDDRLLERVQFAQSIPDVLGGVILAESALLWLRQPVLQERVFGVVGLLAAVAVAVAFARELWMLLSGRRHGEEGWLEWTDLLVGGMLILGVLHGWSERGKLFRPDLLMGAVLLIKSVLQPWAKRRFGARSVLRMDAAGLRVQITRFRGFGFEWAELASARVDEKAVVFTTHAGRVHRLRLPRYGNRDEIRSALRARLAAAGLLPGS